MSKESRWRKRVQPNEEADIYHATKQKQNEKEASIQLGDPKRWKEDMMKK